MANEFNGAGYDTRLETRIRVIEAKTMTLPATGQPVAYFTPDGTALLGPLGTVPIGGTPCEAYGASLSATATVNTAAIQAALNKGGAVTLMTAGEFLINATLVMPDNTEFRLGPNTIVKLAPASNCNMLVNSAYLATPISVAITWASGIMASVAWAAHGKVAGDYVSIAGANQAAYNGVFFVEAVTNANNFVVVLVETPSVAATGTTVARKANFNFSVRGGVWDYNQANQSAPNGLAWNSIIVAHAVKYVIDGQCYKNTAYDCIVAAASRDFEVTRQHSINPLIDINSQIVKVNGPIFNGDVGYISGYSQDDLVSVQSEEQAAYAVYDLAAGSVINFKFHHIGGSSFYNAHAVAIYLPPTGKAWTMTGIVVDGVDCSANTHLTAPPITIGGDPGGANYGSKAGSITIRNITIATPSGQNIFNLDQYCYVRTLTLEDWVINTAGETTVYDAISIAGKADIVNISRFFAATLQSVLTTAATTSIATLNISGLTGSDIVGVVVPNGGTISQINFNGCTLTSSGAGRNYVYPIVAMTIKNITFIGCTAGSNCSTINTGSAALAGVKVGIYGGYYNTAAYAWVNNHAASFLFSSVTFDACTAGCRTDGAATVSLSSGSGNSLLNGSVLVSISTGTLALSLFGWDLPYDVITGIASVTLSTAAGQYLNSTRAGATNLGSAVRTPAGWVALGTGAAGINTVIA